MCYVPAPDLPPWPGPQARISKRNWEGANQQWRFDVRVVLSLSRVAVGLVLSY